MRRIKAKTHREKCRYGRCMTKRVDNSRYCGNHGDKTAGFVLKDENGEGGMEYRGIPIKVREDVEPGKLFLINESQGLFRREGQLEPITTNGVVGGGELTPEDLNKLYRVASESQPGLWPVPKSLEFTSPRSPVYPVPSDMKPKPSFLDKILAFIFVNP